MTEIRSISYYPLDDIQREFLKYAPAYAQKEAQEAIYKVMDLQMQGVLRDGLYYIVLVDLVASTKYGILHGNQKLAERIKRFVTYSFNSFNEARIRNAGLFVKEIGDAVLFVFQHFPDVLRWRHQFGKCCELEDKFDEPIVLRTCVHVGEVSLQGVNPLSLAVSQVFKFEKEVPGGAIALSELAYHVAWPTLARAYHAFIKIGSVTLDGYPGPVTLYGLKVHDQQDLERMVVEQLE